jgi:hypothetical protein
VFCFTTASAVLDDFQESYGAICFLSVMFFLVIKQKPLKTSRLID